MFEQSELSSRHDRLFYFRDAPPHLERAQPEDAYSGDRPAPPYPGAPGWQCSIYYYWWRFVREIPEFREKVKADPFTYPIGTIIPDFRRVFECNFRDWWVLEGRELFSEPKESGVKLEISPLPARGYEDRVVFSIPLRGDLDQALSELRHLVKPVMAEYETKRSLSRARYPVLGRPSLSAMHQIFTVWRAHRDNPQFTHVELADFLTGDLGTAENDADTKNSKSAAISRYLRKARLMIEYAEKGIFPVTNEANRHLADSWLERLEKDRRRRQMKVILSGKR